MLEVALDLVPPAQVEEEGQRVNIQSSSYKYGNLTGGSSGSLQQSKSNCKSRPLNKRMEKWTFDDVIGSLLLFFFGCNKHTNPPQWPNSAAVAAGGVENTKFHETAHKHEFCFFVVCFKRIQKPQGWRLGWRCDSGKWTAPGPYRRRWNFQPGSEGPRRAAYKKIIHSVCLSNHKYSN